MSAAIGWEEAKNGSSFQIISTIDKLKANKIVNQPRLASPQRGRYEIKPHILFFTCDDI
jgi:hypothetical protein